MDRLYRLLELGEKIADGDECFTFNEATQQNEWMPIDKNAAGSDVICEHTVSIRKAVDHDTPRS